MENRKREIQIIVHVTEQERQLISEKMKQIPTQNLSAYARNMLIDGNIILLDTQEIKAHAAQLQKIGGNINQNAGATAGHFTETAIRFLCLLRNLSSHQSTKGRERNGKETSTGKQRFSAETGKSGARNRVLRNWWHAL